MIKSLLFSVVVLIIAVLGALRGFFALSLAITVAYCVYLYVPYNTALKKTRHFSYGYTQFIPPYMPFIGDVLPSFLSSRFMKCKNKTEMREQMMIIFDEQEKEREKNNNNNNDEMVSFASIMGPVIYTRSAEHVKEMTVTNPWDFPKPTHNYETMKVFGDNIVTSKDGQEHKNHRAICNPAFSNANLEYSAQVASEQLSNLFGLWEAAEGGEKGGFRVDPERGLFNLTLSIIAEAGFGMQFGLARLEEEEARKEEDKGGEMSFEESIHIVSEKLFLYVLTPSFMYHLPIGSLQKIDKGFKVFDKTIREVMAAGEKDQHKKDLISLLVKANKQDSAKRESRQLSNEEIYGNIFMFMFAGHETTAGVLGWALRHLAANPEEQEKAYQEVNQFLEEKGGLMITAKEVETRLIYCKCIFFEAMRQHPVVQIVPKWVEKDTSLGGVPIKQGTACHIDVKLLHNNPRHWKNPEKFNPARFDKRVSEPINPHAFVPFSFGARNCIGQKFAQTTSTIAIARILQRYKISLPADVTEQEVWEEKTVVTTRCANPVKLVFELRE